MEKSQREEDTHKRAVLLQRSASSLTQNETASITLSENSSLDTIEEDVAFLADESLRKRNFHIYNIPEDDFCGHSDLVEPAISPSKFTTDGVPRKSKRRRESLARSLRSVMLVGGAMFLLIVPLTQHFSTGTQQRKKWQRFRKDESAMVLRKAQKATRKRYIVRVQASRVDLVQQTVESLAGCSTNTAIKQIQVDWRSSLSAPKSIFLNPSVVQYGDDSMLKSDAVLLLSEGIIIPCEDLERAFRVWRHNPDRMVGFFAYHHAPSRDTGEDYEIRPSQSDYTLLSDRAAFVHSAYLDSMPKEQRCDDVALSVHATSISNKAPIAISARRKQLVDTQLPSRLECLRDLLEQRDLQELPQEPMTYLGH